MLHSYCKYLLHNFFLCHRIASKQTAVLMERDKHCQLTPEMLMVRFYASGEVGWISSNKMFQITLRPYRW